MGFRFKCHEIGQAIKVVGTIATFCNCITDDEIIRLVEHVKAQARKEAIDADL
jgi:hypothetical protein